MSKFPLIISWVTIFSALFLMSVAFFWYLYPYKVIEIKNSPFKVESRDVESGSYIVYGIDYCNYSKIIPALSKTFIDGIIYEVPARTIQTQLGCHTLRMQTYVPKALPPGEYEIELVFRYQVNPLRQLDFVARTEKFKVIK